MNTVSRGRVSSKEDIVARRRTRKRITEASTIAVVFGLCAVVIIAFVLVKG